jgi:hypothetical protein
MTERRGQTGGVLPWALLSVALLAIVLLGVAFLAAAVPPEAVPAHFWGTDTLCRPNRTVRVDARLYRAKAAEGANPGIAGIPVRLRFRGEGCGTALTDRDGIAVFELRSPSARGNYNLVFEVASPYRPACATATLCVRGTAERVLILDADDLLPRDGPGVFSRGKGVEAAPRAGAPEALGRLAPYAGIIYLSCRHEVRTSRVRAWLRRWKFPPGLLVLRDDTLTDLSAADFLALRLGELRFSWSGEWTGIADEPKDIEALSIACSLCLLVGEGAADTAAGTFLRFAALGDAADHLLAGWR